MKPTFKKLSILSSLLLISLWLIFSCTKDATVPYSQAKQQQLSFYLDSVRIHDSLISINQGGVINYSIQVVSGSSSSLFANPAVGGRKATSQNTKGEAVQDAVSGASITISQYGKKVTATTDATGYVVFQNLLRGAIAVTIQNKGLTDMSYVAAIGDPKPAPTSNFTLHTMSNLIPLFETTGTNMATLTGEATLETDLTNTTREMVPDGTVVTATIDATNPAFIRQFLNTSTTGSSTPNDYVGVITNASYGTGGFTGTTKSGIYSIQIPAAVDGLPIKVNYPDIAGNQKVFEVGSGSGGSFNQISTYRQLYGVNISPTSVPTAAGVNISFAGGMGAAATANMNFTGALSQINVVTGGSGYNGTPFVTITDPGPGNGLPGGTGATATANVTAGVVTSITLTNAGTGYSTNTQVIINSGSGAQATTLLNTSNQSIYSVIVNSQGSGYTSAPAVTFTGGSGSGAAGTANINSIGQVVSVTMTNFGSGYTSAPTVSFTGGGGSGATASVNKLGSPVGSITVNAGYFGSGYSYAPIVIIDPPSNPAGTPATATATVDPNTGQVTGYTITNPGSGYSTAPNVTVSSGAGAKATANLVGGSVLSASITNGGTQFYTGAPSVRFVNVPGSAGQGAAGTAVLTNGVVTSITITNGGTGYTAIPQIVFDDPSGAQAYALISNGQIGSITMANGGFNYNAAPIVSILPTTGAPGGGAVATATVSGGQVTGVTISNGGSGYIGGNVPSSSITFRSTHGSNLISNVGNTIVNDVYYGTGQKQH